MEKEFRKMSNVEIFNKIYNNKVWGVNKDGYANSGAGSYLPYIIYPYIDVNFCSLK